MLLHKIGRVSVYTACACSICQDPKSRWFQCRDIKVRFVAEYQCTPEYIGDWEEKCNDIDEEPRESQQDTPHHKCLAEIQVEHPGCVFVYLQPPAWDLPRYEREVREAVNKLKGAAACAS